jgi:hypothetical protein
MMSVDTDAPRGVMGIASNADIAARQRPITIADAASNFMDFSYLDSPPCHDATATQDSGDPVARSAPYQYRRRHRRQCLRRQPQ